MGSTNNSLSTSTYPIAIANITGSLVYKYQFAIPFNYTVPFVAIFLIAFCQSGASIVTSNMLDTTFVNSLRNDDKFLHSLDIIIKSKRTNPHV